MWTSSRAFRNGLYEEHLQEASFLFTQCRVLRDDDGVAFDRIADFEQRLAAHVQALAIGGDAARLVCERGLDEAEGGQWYAATVLACFTQDLALLARLSSAVEEAHHAQRDGFADALLDALPHVWHDQILSWLSSSPPSVATVFAEVAAVRRLPCRKGLLRLACEAELDPRLMRALAWCDVAEASPILERVARSTATPELRREALLALARLDHETALNVAMLAIDLPEVSHLAIGLTGDRPAVAALLGVLREGLAAPVTLQSLALLGRLIAVRPLLAHLGHAELGSAAATALEWITGAGLFADHFEPEDADPQAMFPDERRRFRASGEIPRRVDGRPYGQTVRRVTRDAQAWSAWLDQNASRFDANRRFRFGNPVSLPWLVELLGDTTRQPSYRACAASELVVRYRAPAPALVRLPVARQFQTVRSLATWAVETLRRDAP